MYIATKFESGTEKHSWPVRLSNVPSIVKEQCDFKFNFGKHVKDAFGDTSEPNSKLETTSECVYTDTIPKICQQHFQEHEAAILKNV